MEKGWVIVILIIAVVIAVAYSDNPQLQVSDIGFSPASFGAQSASLANQDCISLLENYREGTSIVAIERACSDLSIGEAHAYAEEHGMFALGDECSIVPRADINQDGFVNTGDIVALLAGWRCSDCPGDINEDGEANVGDIIVLLSQWTGSEPFDVCQCADETDNDGDGLCDFDGHEFVAGVCSGEPDPGCDSLSDTNEFNSGFDMYERYQKLFPSSGFRNIFGASISIVDDIAVIGAPSIPANSQGGNVFVFRQGDFWLEEQSIESPNNRDLFGHVVKFDLDKLIVGAPHDDEVEENSGAIYYYDYNPTGSEFTLVQKILPSQNSSGFGDRLDYHSDYLIVGQKVHGSESANSTGRADLYKFVGESWILDQVLTLDNPTGEDWFGEAVAIHGDYAFVSAQGYDIESPEYIENAGAVFVYKKNIGTGDWEFYQELIMSDAEQGDFVGEFIELDRERAIISNLQDDEHGAFAGAAFFFEFNPVNEQWEEKQKITASDADGLGLFGLSLHLNQDKLIVGAFNSSYYFEFESGLFVEKQKIANTDSTGSPSFGSRGSASNSEVLMIADVIDDEQGFEVGTVHVYDQNEHVTPACDDDLDNDGDGYCDFDGGIPGTECPNYPEPDIGCSDRFDSSEENPVQFDLIDQVMDAGTGAINFGQDVTLWNNYAIVGSLRDVVLPPISRQESHGADLEFSSSNPEARGVLVTFNNFNLLVNNVTISDQTSGVDVLQVRSSNNNLLWETDILVGNTFIFDPPIRPGNVIKRFEVDRSGGGNWDFEFSAPFEEISNDAITWHGGSIGGGINTDTLFAIESFGLTQELNYDDRGAVYTYENVGGEYLERQFIISSDGDYFDNFGYSLDIFGNYMAVGAPFKSFTQPGSVYVFEYNQGSEEWEEKQILSSPSEYNGDKFGIDVAIDGDTMIIGAESEDFDSTLNPGAAYVYRLIDGAWIFQQRLTSPEPWYNSYFGGAVDIEGDQIVIGARGQNITAESTGVVYSYVYDGASWNFEQQFISEDASSDDEFGFSLDLNDNHLIVGAPQEDQQGTDAGAIYLFRKTQNTWEQIRKITQENDCNRCSLGYSVKLDLEDQLIFSGAKDFASGKTYVFSNESGFWRQIQEIDAPDLGGDFGHAVDYKDNHLISSSPRIETAYIYKR